MTSSAGVSFCFLLSEGAYQEVPSTARGRPDTACIQSHTFPITLLPTDSFSCFLSDITIPAALYHILTLHPLNELPHSFTVCMYVHINMCVCVCERVCIMPLRAYNNWKAAWPKFDWIEQRGSGAGDEHSQIYISLTYADCPALLCLWHYHSFIVFIPALMCTSSFSSALFSKFTTSHINNSFPVYCCLYTLFLALSPKKGFKSKKDCGWESRGISLILSYVLLKPFLFF